MSRPDIEHISSKIQNAVREDLPQTALAASLELVVIALMDLRRIADSLEAIEMNTRRN